MKLAGCSAVVTGGASGLGHATAHQLAHEGATVVIADLASSDGAAAAAQVGNGTRFKASDVTVDGGLDDAFATARSEAPLRAVVHCAGRGGDRLRILDREGNPAPLEAFQNMLHVNLTGTYNLLRTAAHHLAQSPVVDDDRGSIVLTASVAAFEGQVGQTSYSASKAAIHGMTLVAARDLASRAIRVNTIAPGLFDTPMLARLRDDVRDGIARSVAHPHRLGLPSDYAQLAIALLENPYVNGETVRLDGAVRMAAR